MGARETALNVLIACRKNGAWSNGAFKEYAVRDKLDQRETALAARLCYGVLQNRGKLDFYLKQLLTGKIKNLHPAVHDILQLGLYQIYEMDKIPQSAAVNESVALAKKYCRKIPSAAGLVNGVLRNAVRTKGTLKEPENLWEKYSHSKDLVQKLGRYVGQENLEKMLQANNAPVSVIAQINTLKTTQEALTQQLISEGVTVEKHSWLENCLVLGGTGNLEQLPSFRDGLYYVQDAAARLSVLCAGIFQGAKVLDCCAAPGGKTFAAGISGAGEITSCDIHRHKIALIQNGAQRLGLSQVTAKEQDASAFCPRWESAMDIVIADVPCSGYGIIRKKPDIRYKNPKDMESLPELQLAILKNQARYIRPGGVLMYSTCTLVREENEGVVEKFLQENANFFLEPLPLPEVFPENKTGMFTLVPGQYDTDGFFICRLRRKKA